MLAPDAMKPFIVLFVRVRHRDERSCHLQFRVFWTRGHFRTASTPNFRLPTARRLFGKHRPKKKKIVTNLFEDKSPVFSLRFLPISIVVKAAADKSAAAILIFTSCKRVSGPCTCWRAGMV